MAIKHLAPESLFLARRQAVELRLAGCTLSVTAAQTGLSAPTVIKAFKVFKAGGWAALEPVTRGRKAGEGGRIPAQVQKQLREVIAKPPPEGLWSRERLLTLLQDEWQVQASARSVGRLLESWGLLLPEMQLPPSFLPAQAQLKKTGGRLLLACCRSLPGPEKCYQFAVQTPQRQQLWLESAQWPSEAWLVQVLQRLQEQISGPLLVCLQGLDLRRTPELDVWLSQQGENLVLLSLSGQDVFLP